MKNNLRASRVTIFGDHVDECFRAPRDPRPPRAPLRVAGG